VLVVDVGAATRATLSDYRDSMGYRAHFALPEKSDASQFLAFRGVTASAAFRNVPTSPANHGDFAALVLHGFLSPKAAAEQLGVHRETIYRLCARGELPHVRIGAVLRVDLGAYVARKGTLPCVYR
jgi:excisionase family DNA binding protein